MAVKIQLSFNLANRHPGFPNKGGDLLRWVPLLGAPGAGGG